MERSGMPGQRTNARAWRGTARPGPAAWSDSRFGLPPRSAPPCGLRSDERVHGEIPGRVGPHRDGRPAGAGGERLEGRERVLVAALGVDGLTRRECERLAAHVHLLGSRALEMHLDPACGRIAEGAVAEAREIEVG